jgi:RNA 2',3'-cyclic 3'-phosphodiesterase
VAEETGGVAGELRTFIAVELSDEVKTALGEIQAGLRARLGRAGVDRGVRWVDPAGVHLTLKFLGATPAELVAEISRRLGEALAGQARFEVALGETGAFPNARAPRVLWVGLTGDLEALALTQQRVEAALAPLGFPTESRPFSPHLTLARLNDWVPPTDRQLIGQIVQDQRPRQSERLSVTAISLVQSELGRGGARYTRLGDVALAGDAEAGG